MALRVIILHTHRTPPRPPRWGRLRLPVKIRTHLKKRNFRLYHHQAEALRALSSTPVVALTTPTASGKSLVYWIELLRALEKDPPRRILYLAPLKALLEDQRRKALDFLEGYPDRVRVEILSGDTPPGRRRDIRRRPPPLLIATPEMLHTSLLPFHPQWESFWKHLDLMVIDEAHVYRGILGSHMSGVLRRAHKIWKHYGGSPRHLILSATLEGDEDFFKNLTGLHPVRIIRKNTAPQPEKTYIIAEVRADDDAIPPQDVVLSTLTRQLIAQGHRVLAFAKTRRGVEKAFSHLADMKTERVAPYRAGYLPEVRREIETAMVEGDLMGLIATSAMELGVDIGDLSAVLIVGFPGSKMAFYQRCGRAGRREPGLCMFVPSLDALDQYYRDHPEKLLDFQVEQGVLWPYNPYVLVQHVALACWEIAEMGYSMTPHLLTEIFGDQALAALDDLESHRPEHFQRFLIKQEKGFFSAQRRHALIQSVGLRTTGPTWEIWDETTGELLGTVSPPHLYEETYPQAVYYHMGETYEVTQWEEYAQRVWVRPLRLAIETEVLYDTDVEILRVRRERFTGSWKLSLGEVRVVRTYIGLIRYRKGTREVLSSVVYENPIRWSFETTALWLCTEASTIWDAYARQNVLEVLKQNPSLPEWTPAYQLGAGLHGAEHGAIGMFPTVILADRSDIGGLSTPYHFQTGLPTVFIYDGVEGGAGYADAAFEKFEFIAQAAFERIERCGCELDSGCPSCIQSPKCGNANRVLSKKGALAVLERSRPIFPP